MKHLLRSLISGLLITSAGVASAAIIPFDANGVFADGSTLSGIVTIDNATGIATDLDLVVSGTTSLVFDRVDGQGNVGPTMYQIQAGMASPLPDFNLGLPVAGLIGYLGGNICSDSDFADCSGISGIFFSLNNQLSLQSGSLSMAQAVPEPASLALLALGLVGLGISRRKKV